MSSDIVLRKNLHFLLRMNNTLSCTRDINPSNKETHYSCKGQQLENKSVYRLVNYMSF